MSYLHLVAETAEYAKHSQILPDPWLTTPGLLNTTLTQAIFDVGCPESQVAHQFVLTLEHADTLAADRTNIQQLTRALGEWMVSKTPLGPDSELLKQHSSHVSLWQPVKVYRYGSCATACVGLYTDALYRSEGISLPEHAAELVVYKYKT